MSNWSSSEVYKMGLGSAIGEAKRFLSWKKVWQYVEVKAFRIEMCSLGDFLKVAAGMVGVKANNVGEDSCPFNPALPWFSLARTLCREGPIPCPQPVYR